MLLVNEQSVPYKEGRRLADLAAEILPEADIFIVNGYPADAAAVVRDGDNCWLIRRGEIPDAEEMDRLLYARHSPGVHDRVKNATVGIMGLGGLGSVVAIALARIGIGRLVLADFDVVEPSNLNRQQYFVDQIGMRKTKALNDNLSRVNPYVTVETMDIILTEENIPQVFAGVDVLAECFDNARMKAAAVRAVKGRMAGVKYVGASGLAGYGDNNRITTRRVFTDVYIVGDGESAAEPGQGLMAPRVGIAAHHQANQILRLLLEDV